MSISLKKWVIAILVAMLFSCTLALFGPAQLFLTNSLEFGFSFSKILPFLGVITFCIFLPVVQILMLLPDRFNLHERGVAVVFALGLLLWFQGNFLVWKYGLFNGHEIDWGKKIIYGLIDTPLWIVCLLLAACRPAFLYRRAKTLSLLILSIQLLVASFFVINQPELPSFKKFQIDPFKQFDFSNRKNIIILVLDTFQSDIFQEIIDQYPAYKNYFKDFTYFRNTTGGFPSTYAAIPFMLTAQYYTNSQPIQSFIADAYSSPSSIPHELLKLGWEVDFFPSVRKSIFFDPTLVSNIRARKYEVNKNKLAYLFDITLFRYLPHFLKREIYNGENWFLTRWGRKSDNTNLLDDVDLNDNERQAFLERRRARHSSPRIRRIRRLGKPILQKSVHVNLDVKFVSNFLKRAVVMNEKNVFKFYHWRGIHEPIQINANLEPVNLPSNRANVIDMARGELKLVHLFLEGLRELGVYDNTLIFILGDHGNAYGMYGLRLPSTMTDIQSGGGSIPKGVLESGIPLLLVKRPGNQGNLEINDAPASQADISATVFNDLGLGRVGMGESLFQIPVDRPRERRFLYYYWEDSDWMNRFFPNLIEYQVIGNCWLTSSWHATGKVFKPGG
jgi:hypothetical protein